MLNEDGNMINADWNQNEVERGVLVCFYLG